MAKSLPPMMQVMKDIGGIELPESLVKLGGNDTPAPSQNGHTEVPVSLEAAEK